MEDRGRKNTTSDSSDEQGGEQGDNLEESQEEDYSNNQGKEQGDVFSGEGHSFWENIDLSSIPGETSFWSQKPIQSSPEKLVSIPENKKVTLPGFVYNYMHGEKQGGETAVKNYGTRSKNLPQHYEIHHTKEYKKKNKDN